ncbi:MAG: glycogen debranching protein GlgX [Desulfobaccales bacterium]
MKVGIGPGQSFPLGATIYPDGVNFSVYSKNATGMDLLLFAEASDSKPAHIIGLDPVKNRTHHYWHIFLSGLRHGQLYGYRVRGPFEPEHGLRFDAEKVLLDPYARCLAIPENYSRQAASLPGDNAATAMKSVVVDLSGYDWEGDTPLKTPFSRTVIYELHVRGFTQHPSSGVAPEKRGTYAGLVEKIPYLQDIGITAAELLPVFQFDAQNAPLGQINYWGYAPVSFFALHQGYSSKSSPMATLDEFRDMVKALHRAGLEVILDVVFNHTAEGDHQGATLGFRGLQNDAYYILEKDRAYYRDYTGTGNTLNANNPIVRRMIINSLRFWVKSMHIDGFRFDLASVLSRDESGTPLMNPPIIWDISTDPVLAGTKLIAEAWDAGGLYQVGTFTGDFWKEWNGKFRDDVRSFMKGDRGVIRKLTCRLLGSSDIFGEITPQTDPSINFITCHDGFTLNDLVSYNDKHNEANGESNRDGRDDNLSWNCGAEGPTADSAIAALRHRQIKNLLALTLMALGTPMLLMGDEFRRTQRGNNNAYCQDNDTSWLDWTQLDRYPDIHRFVKQLIALRLHLCTLTEKSSVPCLSQILSRAEIQFHGASLDPQDWADDAHSLALTARDPESGLMLNLMINAYWEPLEFELPPLPQGQKQGWHCWLDTSLPSPNDIVPWAETTQVSGYTYLVQARSLVGLMSRR